MNPLNNYPRVREVLFFIQWLVTGAQTVASAAFAFMHPDVADWPRWFLGSLAVTPVLWTYLGITAQQNVPRGVSGNHSPRPLPDDWDGPVQPSPRDHDDLPLEDFVSVDDDPDPRTYR